MRINYIDADSLMWILAANHKDHQEIGVMKQACDDFFNTILDLTRAEGYLGVFSPKASFRQKVYRFAEYKGHRPEKPTYMEFWEPIIKGHFTEKYGFIQDAEGGLEADDVVLGMAEYNREKYPDFIISSPDKDLRQTPAEFYDYKSNMFLTVAEVQAAHNLWCQVLAGDSTDNIKGIIGCGPEKAKKILDGLHPIQYKDTVKHQYLNMFGNHYGPQIFEETLAAVKMVTSKHWYYPAFEDRYKAWSENAIQKRKSRIDNVFTRQQS